MSEKTLLTSSGLREFEEELQELKVNKRAEIAQKIKEAREQGDLSENAEYDAAKDEQRDIEARIEELENIIKNAEVMDEDTDAEVVNFGSKVVVKDMATKNVETYKIVGSTEAKILEKKISNESPLGAALMKKKAGDTIVVEAPAGTFKYKIMEIK